MTERQVRFTEQFFDRLELLFPTATRDLELEGRAGIHVGEVEQRGDDIGGIAVHLAARVMAEAAPGKIIVTSTVSLSSLGGRHRFSPRGLRALKGFEHPWELFAVEPNDF